MIAKNKWRVKFSAVFIQRPISIFPVWWITISFGSITTISRSLRACAVQLSVAPCQIIELSIASGSGWLRRCIYKYRWQRCEKRAHAGGRCSSIGRCYSGGLSQYACTSASRKGMGDYRVFIKIETRSNFWYFFQLLPEIGGNPNISMLLKACDRNGPKDCALLPLNHCLHTPGGPLKVTLPLPLNVKR